MHAIFKKKKTNIENPLPGALTILQVVAHTDGGAEMTVMDIKDTFKSVADCPVAPVCHNCSLVRSRLDYGCIVCGPGTQSYLKQLDPIHHQDLRPGRILAIGFGRGAISGHYIFLVISVFRLARRIWTTKQTTVS